MNIYLKTVFAELQSKINFLARNKIYIVKIYIMIMILETQTSKNHIIINNFFVLNFLQMTRLVSKRR
jgi:hypothetical protein